MDKNEGIELAQDWRVRRSRGAKDKLFANVDCNVGDALLD